jgi:cell division protein DivIC
MNRLYKILKNKYFIILILFVIWILAIDRNNLIRTMKVKAHIRQLENDILYYKAQIEESKKTAEDLMNNTKTLETFAREKYFMKKDNEDIFIVDESD